jgi:hypothetical protein
MDFALDGIAARILERPAALDPDPAIPLRAAQMRHALGDRPAAQAVIDELLGGRPGFWPALLERSDLRAVCP